VDTDKEEPKGFWQSASAVKKATLILMPFAVIASYFMLQPEAPGPAPRVVNSAGSAAAKRTVPDGGASLPAANFANPELVVGAATEAGVQGAGAAAIAADSRGARVDAGTAKIAPLTAGKKTPEREALDTAAAGSFDDAARRYDTLAAAHPGEPSYKEAARILRDKASRPH
jgi:hypothetical protein